MDKMSDPASAVSERDAAARPDRRAPQASFEAFFEAEDARLLRALYLVTGNMQEAEEVAQDAFLAAWERWDRVRVMEEPTGYLFRAAMNRLRSLRRRAARAARRAIGRAESGDPFAEVDQRDALARALAALPARQRAAIVLTELLGYGSEQAGLILGVKDVTIRSLASQARAALRRSLEDSDE
jgi:RNA polymerase sigma-70 factor (ECF subfamily)